VLFLDDMQWADAASLELLKVLLTDVGRKKLLVIAAYRDNEVENAHPLWSLIEAVEKSGAAAPRLQIGPLTDVMVRQWMSVTLSTTVERVSPLAHALRRKTEGNPFFLGRLLLELATQKRVWRNLETGAWEWDQGAIEHAALTANVVELIRSKVVELPASTQEL